MLTASLYISICVVSLVARTTTSSDDIHGFSQSSGSEEAKQLNSLFNRRWTSSRCTGLQQKHQYHKLAPAAQDLQAAPASQAYIERIFSVCGLLTAGRRNRMNTLYIPWNAPMHKAKLARIQTYKQTGFVFLQCIVIVETTWNWNDCF